MYFSVKKIFVLLMLLVIVGFSSAKTNRFRIDSVVAVVNDDIITMTDLQRSLLPLVKQLKANYTGRDLVEKVKDAEKKVLNQLIENKLILQTAVDLQENQELKIPEKEIVRYVQRIIDRFPSRDVFEDTLKRENLSLEDFKKDCIDQLLVKKLASMKVSSRVFVSNSDIQEYYQKNITNYTSQAKVTFAQIWLKKDGNQDQKKKDLINSIITRIKNGEDFKSLAVQYSEGPHASEGGVWKNVHKGQFTPELDEKLWNLSPGQTSELIETATSFHLLRVEVVEKPNVVPIEKVWSEIENKIYFQRADDIRKKWISTLKQDAFIQINYE